MVNRYRIQVWQETERPGVWRPLRKHEFASEAGPEEIAGRVDMEVRVCEKEEGPAE